ncbi:MAG: Ig-like domain-containing protein [Bacteroidetes bacterium]|nr:Ig-like domain-containing protein [Bacteroidota bacterium]
MTTICPDPDNVGLGIEGNTGPSSTYEMSLLRSSQINNPPKHISPSSSNNVHAPEVLSCLLIMAAMSLISSCRQPTQPSSGMLSSIRVTPQNTVISAEATLQFTAKGFDQTGHEVAIKPRWSVSGGGTISDSGLFAAGKANGTFWVTAQQNEITGTASIFVGWNSPYVAGFRASRILSNYPNHQFPGPDYWVGVGDSMAKKFNDATPAAIWIVSLYMGSGITQVDFPSPGGSYSNIVFSDSDYSQSFLTRFDKEGFKVWLQVEPGAASVDTLISLVLSRYRSHPCVVGFGVDVEWYDANLYQWGEKVTDADAQRWEQEVQSYNPQYTLFLKHFARSWMPPTYRGNIIFVDDSQQFASLSDMVYEYKAWGRTFYPSRVSFQIGYPADKSWWGQYSDPPRTIGTALMSAIPNAYGVFWVDFTVTQVFPPTIIASPQQNQEKGKPHEFYRG